ncbi:DUF3761 domain-containing protein [Streptomyces mirabilis]|uniref:DUF3761 domain-containing protein n=1 Tax=Streptomyces mirabilis TaxID=68239 RepID=UPI0036900C4D
MPFEARGPLFPGTGRRAAAGIRTPPCRGGIPHRRGLVGARAGVVFRCWCGIPWNGLGWVLEGGSLRGPGRLLCRTTVRLPHAPDKSGWVAPCSTSSRDPVLLAPWPSPAPETINAHQQEGETVLTKLRAGLAAFAIAGALLVPVVAATPAAAASCAHHTTGSCQANSPHPRAATAKCKDSSYSYARSFRGTCSHHRGVKYWYR